VDPDPGPDPAAAARLVCRLSVLSRPAVASCTATVIDVPSASVVIAARSPTTADALSGVIVMVFEPDPPCVDTISVELAGTVAEPSVAGTTGPVGVRKDASTDSDARLTTSTSKMPVTPADAPTPMYRSRAAAVTCSPSNPFGCTNRRISGRKNPCQLFGMVRAPAGRLDGPAVSDRSSTAPRNPKPTAFPGPTIA